MNHTMRCTKAFLLAMALHGTGRALACEVPASPPAAPSAIALAPGSAVVRDSPAEGTPARAAPAPRPDSPCEGATRRQETPANLAFSEFFKMPVGPLGLEPSEKLRSLDGHRVHLRGFMVKMCACQPGQCRHVPGRLLLSPMPVNVDDGEMTFCDDLPPATVYVTLPRARSRVIPHVRGPLDIVGILSLGNQEEPDGRISLVRVEVDVAPDSPGPGAAPGAAPAPLVTPTLTPSPVGTSPTAERDRSPSDAKTTQSPTIEGEKK